MNLRRFLNPEGFGLFLEAALRVGFASSAALALALGQVTLALVLAFVAFGMFLRVWRLRRRRRR